MIFMNFDNPDKIYTITLANGDKITNLKLNGNNFVSERQVTEDMFEGNLSRVIISSEDGSMEFHNMELIQITTYDNGETWYFILAEIPKAELRLMNLESNMEYVAMMADVEL